MSTNSNNNQISSGSAGSSSSREANPFARSGLARSPLRRVEAGGGSSARSASAGTHISSPANASGEVMDGAWLMRAINKSRDGLSAMEVAAQQLDSIIDFASSKSNISKDLKQALLRLRKSMLAAKQNHAEPMVTVAAAEPVELKVPKSTQTEPFVFAGSPKSVEANAYSKQSQKRARQPSGEELPGGARKARRILTPKTGRSAGKSDPSQASRKAEKGGPEKAGPSRSDGNRGLRPLRGPPSPQVRAEQGGDAPWTTVVRKKKKKEQEKQERRDTRPKKGRRVGAKREKGDAIIIKTEESKYSEVLKAMRSDAKLADLGADVRSVRRTRTGEMILELKRDKERKGAAYKSLAEEVLGAGVEVRALTQSVTLKVMNLDEITNAEELVTALRQQCEVQVPTTAVQLRKGPAGTQVALVHLPVADANKSAKVGKIKVGWSVCSLNIHEQPVICFRCREPGHKSWGCKGPDRTKLCRRCGEEGHKALGCKNPPKCLICSGKSVNNNHPTGGSRCPTFKRAINEKSQCR